MTKISYAGYRFPPEIIHQAIWLYLRFTLSLRDVEDLLAERGVAVSYETVRRWVNHFGPMIEADLRKRRQKPHTTWHLDEVYLKIDGRMVYLWRAVDAEGEVLDVLVQSKRNKHAALKLMRKLLKKYAFVPERLVTDDLRSYSAAVNALGIEHCHERWRWKNNEAENSHQPTRRRERKMQRFKSTGSALEIPVNACRRLQHLQRPTPSHLSPNASCEPRCGYGHVADGGRSGLTIP
jgi:putative transposase